MIAASKTLRMLCPRCGAAMNHHADKLVPTIDPRDPGQSDVKLGGVIEEFHACPNCGYGVARQA
jgi:ribosomal protein S27AE